MKSLVILVVVTYCSAQLVLPSTSWVLPTTKLITTSDAEPEVKTVALTTPYLHPFGHNLVTPYAHPLGHSLVSPYAFPLGHHLPYVVSADPSLKATEFPYVYERVEAEEPAVEEARRRRRRGVSVPLPYIHAIPTVKKTTIETKQFETTDDATPADTTLIALTTAEHEVSIPAVKYVQPHVNIKPVTYTAVSPFVASTSFVSPAVLPYHAAYPAVHHPFYYPTLAGAPVIKIDEPAEE